MLGLGTGGAEPERSYWLFTVLVLAESLPIAARRRRPLLVLAVAAGALSASLALGLPATAAALGTAVAVYTVVVRCARANAFRLTSACGLAVLASLFVDDGRVSADDFFLYLALFTVPWLVGSRIRRTRDTVAELEERAVRAERERARDAERAAAVERARLARELHDVVSHAVSVAVVQASAAARVLRTKPDKAAEHVAAIESAGRQAMAELRRLLGILRDDGDSPGPLDPQPGVGDLPDLVRRVEGAGLPVRLTVEGEEQPLPASLDLSVYRIVQESLTNSLRHAGPARARVLLRYERDYLELAVCDDGRGAPDPPREGGHGLVGMRERVAVFGGTLHTTNRPDGGFEVRVRLPLDPSFREH